MDLYSLGKDIESIKRTLESLQHTLNTRLGPIPQQSPRTIERLISGKGCSVGMHSLFVDALSYDDIRARVIANNKASSNFSTELITCQIWKESSFNPSASNGAHIGLMQIGPDAVAYVNNNTPTGVHFNYPADLFDPDLNIQCGTYYLSIWMAKNGTSVPDTLNAFGTGPGYADNILQCEQCIHNGTSASQDCLNAIHT